MPCHEHGFAGVASVESAMLRALRAPKDFVPADTPERFPPDVPVDWQELTLVVEVDVAGKHVRGTATYDGTVRKNEVRRLRFDADGIEVLRAHAGDGRRLGLEHDGREAWVDLGPGVERGTPLRVSLDFDTRDPRAGFYFILPDEDHPDRPAHAWTQGQDEDSRFWFPCHDSPNHKLRLHVIATVPDGLMALSNGVLRNIYRAADPDKRIFDWQLSRPVPTYLLTLAVGPFVEVKQQEEPVPISYYVLPGREDDGERSFARTPQMVRFFEDKLGVPYPYEKYAQVAVSEFVFGGMENASMTTQTDLTLHDARAHVDFSSEPLVAHELAHQWFGDLVTCRTWSHGWLNEGFATYFEQLWREHTETPDEFDYFRLQANRVYFQEDAGRYRRPIVTLRYDEPIDVFDAHLYEKGGAILHMLRKTLGDETFFGGLRSYLLAHADGSVETPDLRRALETYSGQNLGRFFHQWVEVGKGHPELKISGTWDGEQRQYRLTLEQTHDTAHAPLFRLDVPVAFHLDGGQVIERSFTLERKQQTFHVDLPAVPAMVLVDGRGDLLATHDLGLPEPMLKTTLSKAPFAMARIQAALALGKRPSATAVDALTQALTGDASWCVQAEVAKVLGRIGSQAAFDALQGAVGLPHPKARRAVRAALGRFQTAKAGELLADLLGQGDASYFVEAETALALGSTRSPAALPALRQALERPSWNETVRVGVLEGLAVLQDPAGIELARPFLARKWHTLLRCGAVRCLAGFHTEPAKVLEALRPWVADTGFRFAVTLASALGGLGDARAVPLLQELADRAVDGRVKKRAQESIAALRAGLGAGKQVEGLRSDVDTLRNQLRELTDRLDRTEQLKKPAVV